MKNPVTYLTLSASLVYWASGCVVRNTGESQVRVGIQAEQAMKNTAKVAGIEAEKATLSVAHQKLDSNIVLALKQRRGEPPFDRPTELRPSLAIQSDGRVLVDLDARVSKDLLGHIKNAGGEVINAFEAARSVRAIVPLTQMEALAGREDITFIAPAAQVITNQNHESRIPHPRDPIAKP